MSGNSERGFTLIEVLIALTVVSVAFTVLLETLSQAMRGYRRAEETFSNMLVLDSKLKEGDHEGVKVHSKKLPDFPNMREVVYSYGDVFFIRYEVK